MRFGRRSHRSHQELVQIGKIKKNLPAIGLTVNRTINLIEYISGRILIRDIILFENVGPKFVQ